MKTFFNVLYRRILYKIPLKWLLIFIALFAICFASYSNASFTKTLLLTDNGPFNDKYYTNNDYDVLCLENVNCPDGRLYFAFAPISSSYAYYGNYGNGLACGVENVILYTTSANCQIKIYGYKYNNYTSLQCQTNYNLIPISSVDQNYCTTNNLCPSCPECETCESFTGTLSNVYINGINHIGAPNIVMNIAEEIDWDYAYTAGGQNMNIDVVGYNVDYEKMQSVIDTQNYKPTQEDFQNLILILGPYSKIILFFVFLFLVWAWIKKPFKSKKL